MTLIIAEAGVNHNGSINLAKELIDAASEAGADIVKFQTYKTDLLATHFAKKADYQAQATGSLESQYDMLQKLELSEEAHHELFAHCRRRKIGFLSTGFDIGSVSFLANLGQECFKIPSGEITNIVLLRHIAKLSRSIILSTGMSTLSDIEAALAVFYEEGLSRDRVTLLHCTSEYPAPIASVNLQVIKSLKRAFGVSVGYSDHTRGIEIPIAAVALGATIIEKHFTLDCNLPGPDHYSSLEPFELQKMVSAIRNIELALGDGVKSLTDGEISNSKAARRSIVACQPINAGNKFTHENICMKRPGIGISPMRVDEVIGKTAIRDFQIDELIEL